MFDEFDSIIKQSEGKYQLKIEGFVDTPVNIKKSNIRGADFSLTGIIKNSDNSKSKIIGSLTLNFEDNEQYFSAVILKTSESYNQPKFILLKKLADNIVDFQGNYEIKAYNGTKDKQFEKVNVSINALN